MSTTKTTLLSFMTWKYIMLRALVFHYFSFVKPSLIHDKQLSDLNKITAVYAMRNIISEYLKHWGREVLHADRAVQGV